MTKPNEPEALEPCPDDALDLARDAAARYFENDPLNKARKAIAAEIRKGGYMDYQDATQAALYGVLAGRRHPAQAVADAGGVTDADREAYLAMNMLPEFDAADVRAGLWDKVTGVQAFTRHRLQSVAAATAKLQDRIEELTNEAEIFDQDHADQSWMVDRIADLIGLPQDQELDTVAFELWISAQTAATAAKDTEIARLKGQFDRYFHEAANAQEEVERLREGIERALCCTPSIQSERSQFHGIGDTHKIVYDCGNPWEILRAALAGSEGHP